VRLVFLGPPGAGKGTQAARVAAAVGVPAISTGDIFRANVREGTPLGAEAQRYMDAGEYVPDSVTNAMVRDRLAQPDAAHGFLLDGYPRTLEQVGELDGMLTAARTALDRVVEITANEDEIVRRLLARAEVEGRADDTAEVIANRLKVYAEATAPLAQVYADRGLLVQVDGIGEVDDVTSRLLAALGVAGDVSVS
jgi:adenylate kinase